MQLAVIVVVFVRSALSFAFVFCRGYFPLSCLPDKDFPRDKKRGQSSLVAARLDVYIYVYILILTLARCEELVCSSLIGSDGGGGVTHLVGFCGAFWLWRCLGAWFSPLFLLFLPKLFLLALLAGQVFLGTRGEANTAS